MYIAFEDNQKHGSTRLHVDLSDAVNILVHASTSHSGEPGGAEWLIFSRDDTIRLSNVLKTFPEYEPPGDPIQQQHVFLTAEKLQDLKDNHGIIPYTIYQRLGQAVFIPVGCAHQVCLAFFVIFQHFCGKYSWRILKYDLYRFPTRAIASK